LTANQYNVLRILRGSDPTKLTSRELAERMIARDPDVTSEPRLRRGRTVS